MSKVYIVGTKPFTRVKVRKDRVCAICGETIKKGEQADYISWWSYSGARQEWHCPAHSYQDEVSTPKLSPGGQI